MSSVHTGLAGILFLVVAAAASCSPASGPQTGTQTNWLRTCETDAECGGELSCQCGTCTLACQPGGNGCSAVDGAVCTPGTSVGAIALCGGKATPSAGLCVSACTDTDCPKGTACQAGVCAPQRDAADVVTVDLSIRYQTLTGFGAGIAYIDAEVARHPARSALFNAMFADSGFKVVRLRNRYDAAGTNELATSAEIVEQARQRLGRAPTLILTSSSPPAALKANGDTRCSEDPKTCTLARAADGAFDYQGFATHWRASLDAYAAAKIRPDYISIQNDPNWQPPPGSGVDGCRFLPVEGTTTVSANGVDVEVEYPGYAEALTAVLEALKGLAPMPKVAAPEGTGVSATTDFARALSFSRVDALAFHPYGSDPRAVNRSASLALAELGRSVNRPLFQTEMSAEGLDTALLIHEAMGTIGASMYLQNVFVASASVTRPDRTALISLGKTDFALEDTYHAMRHFAHDTDQGWTRAEATVEGGSVLATAWVSPAADAVTVVLINARSSETTVKLALGDARLPNTRVTRTVFAGTERSAELGSLAPNGVVAVPGESIVTIAWRR